MNRPLSASSSPCFDNASEVDYEACESSASSTYDDGSGMSGSKCQSSVERSNGQAFLERSLMKSLLPGLQKRITRTQQQQHPMPVVAKSPAVASMQQHQLAILERSVKRRMVGLQQRVPQGEVLHKKAPVTDQQPLGLVRSSSLAQEEDIIYNIGAESLAHCFSYLEPADVLAVLSSPLSKTWKEVYCDQGYLWKVLCLSEPFHAKESIIEDSQDDDFQYRLLYTRFVRCMTYLRRISNTNPSQLLSSNFHSAFQGDSSIVNSTDAGALNDTSTSSNSDSDGARGRKRSSLHNDPDPSQVHKLPSTTNLYAKARVVKNIGNPVDLPWSCAVYAIINWMVAFSDVLGIQIACLKALPSLLEDEQQRSTAQLSRLSGIVIRSMVFFRDSIQLHTAAFHTLVLLARPIGGKEGMLFQRVTTGGPATSLVGETITPLQQVEHSESSATSIINGTGVILDSMRRFVDNEALQAMGCWSMVNIALMPSQKATLVRLGGIRVLLNAMRMHPNSSDVQLRALFALINLVVPCEHQQQQQPQQSSSYSFPTRSLERQILDDTVNDVTPLVVAAMGKFCNVKDVLNRACLVLHNLSLVPEYHSTLLFTPHCYQMVKWTSANHQNDAVIQQSTSGTLQRLNRTLADDPSLSRKFSSFSNKK